MGLDMFAYVTAEAVPDVDFPHPDSATELFYWRKHPNLHGWMQELYRRKGGKSPEFNTDNLRLIAKDLDDLETAVNKHRLPVTTGFFFGESQPEDKDDDLEFIKKARKAIEDGLTVFYTSWW